MIEPAPTLSRHPWKLPVFSGVLLAASYFTFALPVTNFFAFVPLLVWIDANRDGDWKSWRNGGFAFGLAVNALILHWMYSMLWVSFLAIGSWLALTVIFAAATTACVMVLAWARRTTRWPFAVLLPACWLPVEWLQAQGDLRMTAQHMAHTLAGAPVLVQFADLTGPYGVGAFLLAGNGMAHAIWAGRRAGRWKAPAVALVVLFGAAFGYGLWRWTQPVTPERTVRIALVQPNVPLLTKMDPASDDAQSAKLAELTRRAGGLRPGIIVWPETARPRPLIHDPARPETYAMPEVSGLARETGAEIVTGAEYAIRGEAQGYHVFNAVMLVHRDGTLDPAWTAKTYLVPFVEGIPFRPVLGPLLEGLEGSLRWLSGGFSPGPRGVVLDAAGVKIGATVCFEELYFDLDRELRNAGADVLVVATNHAWFRRSLFQRYAANTVRLRAIENRCSFVRCANTGYSGFVDPTGRWHEGTDLFVEDVRAMDLPIVRGRTVYNRLGDVVAYAAMLVLVLAVAVGRRASRTAV